MEEPGELFDGEDLAGTFVFEEGGVVIEDAAVAHRRCGGVAGAGGDGGEGDDAVEAAELGVLPDGREDYGRVAADDLIVGGDEDTVRAIVEDVFAAGGADDVFEGGVGTGGPGAFVVDLYVEAYFGEASGAGGDGGEFGAIGGGEGAGFAGFAEDFADALDVGEDVGEGVGLEVFDVEAAGAELVGELALEAGGGEDDVGFEGEDGFDVGTGEGADFAELAGLAVGKDARGEDADGGDADELGFGTEGVDAFGHGGGEADGARLGEEVERDDEQEQERAHGSALQDGRFRAVMRKRPGSMAEERLLVIPEGTRVVVRADGRVGEVVRGMTGLQKAYLVRFVNGDTGEFGREELTIQKHVERVIPLEVDRGVLWRCVELKCIVGSRAYGLETDASDTDRRGFYLPPASMQWGLAGVPEQLENEHEECYWEMEKFIRLALRANPNVLECLYSPAVEHCGVIGERMMAMRGMFLSRHIHRTYNAYVLSQFKKIEQDLRNHQAPRWKHVMHLFRLLLSGIVALREGVIALRMDEHREELLAIKAGRVAWDELEQRRMALHREFDAAWAKTKLPEEPDYAKANELLIEARRYAATVEYEKEVMQ